MTESEWLSCDDPSKLLSHLQGAGRADGRRARLFAVACCRRVGHLVLDPQSRHALDVAERYADGLADEPERAAAQAAAAEAAAGIAAPPPDGTPPAMHAVASAYAEAAEAVAAAVAEPVRADEAARRAAGAFAAFDYSDQADADVAAALQGERSHQADLLRDLFRDPFREPPADAPWRTPDLSARAQEIYEQESFERLPALADALAAAGCGDAELLAHLNSEGPHAKGCWALDHVRGKL